MAIGSAVCILQSVRIPAPCGFYYRMHSAPLSGEGSPPRIRDSDTLCTPKGRRAALASRKAASALYGRPHSAFGFCIGNPYIGPAFRIQVLQSSASVLVWLCCIPGHLHVRALHLQSRWNVLDCSADGHSIIVLRISFGSHSGYEVMPAQKFPACRPLLR